MKSLLNLDRAILRNETVIKLTKLYKYIGKNFYYDEVLKSNINVFKTNIIEKNSILLSKFIMNDISDQRLNLLISKKTSPKNNNEQYVLNIMKTFSTIHDHINNFTFTENQIISMFEFLYYKIGKSAKYANITQKDIANGLEIEFEGKIRPVKIGDNKRMILDMLIQQYNNIISTDKYESILVITNFYIDFMHISPFQTDNHISGLIIIYILLFNSGIRIFNFTSFFEVVLNKYSELENTLNIASFNWNKGFSNFDSAYDFIIDNLIYLYEEAELFVNNYAFDKSIKKSVIIINTIKELDNIFTKQQIENQHPTISKSTINRTLEQLRDEGKINPIGKGRGAKWIKTDKSFTRLNFDTTIENFENQMRDINEK